MTIPNGLLFTRFLSLRSTPALFRCWQERKKRRNILHSFRTELNTPSPSAVDRKCWLVVLNDAINGERARGREIRQFFHCQISRALTSHTHTHTKVEWRAWRPASIRQAVLFTLNMCVCARFPYVAEWEVTHFHLRSEFYWRWLAFADRKKISKEKKANWHRIMFRDIFFHKHYVIKLLYRNFHVFHICDFADFFFFSNEHNVLITRPWF